MNIFQVQERAIPYSEDVKGLILAMLRKNPEQRPTITEVSWAVESILDRLQVRTGGPESCKSRFKTT